MHFVIAGQTLRIVAVFFAVALCGIASIEMSAARVTPSEAPQSAAKRATKSPLGDRLLLAQSGSRSYMEGRDFQSYRQDRGFAG